jgi:hypothetical protein
MSPHAQFARGFEPLLRRVGTLSIYRGFGVYSMNKTGGRRTMFIIRANATSRLSSFSAPSQLLLKPLLWDEIVL